MERQLKLKEVKDLIKKHNVTAYEISKNTSLTAAGVQKIINGQSEKPLSVTLDTIYNYLISHYPHNDATYNIKNNNGGDNIYINNTRGSISNSGNTAGGQETTGQHNGQGQEIKEMTKLLNQLHETKIIEIDRLTKLYNGIISNQNEFIDTLKEQNSQYRKEIESLRQRIKGNTENNKE